MKQLLLIALVLMLLAFVPSVALAQDPTPSQSVTIEQPNPLSQTLAWLAVLFGTWSIWSASVMVILDAAKARITAFADMFGLSDYPQARALITLAAVLLASWQTVEQLGYNIFTLPYAPLVVDSGDAQKIITTLFLAAGAIGLHDAIKWRGQVALIERIFEFVDDDDKDIRS